MEAMAWVTEVVPATPDTIDNSNSNEPGESALERCLTAVHVEPLLKFLSPEDLLEFGAASKETIQAVQDHLACCEPEHYWRFFDMLKHFLQTTLVVSIRNKFLEGYSNSADPVPNSGPAVFLNRWYIIDYVTGDLKKHSARPEPLNFMAPGPFGQGWDVDFVEYLRDTYTRPFAAAHRRDKNKVHRKWELPYKDDDSLFSKFAAFMESQLVHVSEEAARVRVAWWYNRRMRFVWAFMHQPLCGLCGDSNTPLTRAICGTCERPYCRDRLNVIVCHTCHDYKREEFERYLEERRALQRRRQEEHNARQREVTRQRRIEENRRLMRINEDLVEQRREAKRQRRGGDLRVPLPRELRAASTSTNANRIRYECPLGNHGCQQYGHEGQECPCRCHHL